MAVLESTTPGSSAWHVCASYDDPVEESTLVLAFLRTALERHHRVIYVSDTTDCSQVAAWFDAAGGDSQAALDTGGLVVRSAASAYGHGETFDCDATLATIRAELRDALDSGFAGLSVAGEMTWALDRKVPFGKLLEYERKVTDLFADGTLSGLCLYDSRRFDPIRLNAIAAVHPIVEHRSTEPSPTQIGSPLAPVPAIGEGRGLVIAGAILLAAAVVNLFSDGQILGLVGIAPFAAAALSGVRQTALVSVATVAVLLAVAAVTGGVMTIEQAERLPFIIATSAVALIVARGRARRDLALARMTRLAAVAQLAILPTPPPHIRGVEVAARYVSAYQDASVGGDFYEFVQTRGVVLLMVGDVRGHGLDAVRTAASVAGSFRDAALTQPTISDAVRHVDRLVAATAGRDEFVTAVAIEVHDDGRILMVSCGHPDPLRVSRAQIAACEPVWRTTPLGLGPDVVVSEHRLERGDFLVISTDGLHDARDADGVTIDVSAALCRIRESRPAADAAALADALMAQLDAFVGGRHDDDTAIVVLRRR